MQLHIGNYQQESVALVQVEDQTSASCAWPQQWRGQLDMEMPHEEICRLDEHLQLEPRSVLDLVADLPLLHHPQLLPRTLTTVVRLVQQVVIAHIFVKSTQAQQHVSILPELQPPFPEQHCADQDALEQQLRVRMAPVGRMTAAKAV